MRNSDLRKVWRSGLKTTGHWRKGNNMNSHLLEVQKSQQSES